MRPTELREKGRPPPARPPVTAALVGGGPLQRALLRELLKEKGVSQIEKM